MPATIQDSVGIDGRNRSSDVESIQVALKEAARLVLDDRLDPGPVDGVYGDGTSGAIIRMQSRISIAQPDGRIDRDGYTLRRLNALLNIESVQITFPFARSSAYPYVGPGGGMRMFGWPRMGGRAHAGIDLYMPDFTPVLAMADGVVTKGPYPFYWETYAIEVDHGSFLARYAEIAPEATWLAKTGDTVRRGQAIGRVGILKKDGQNRYTGVPSMMLHLEMYDQTATGRLYRVKETSAIALNRRPYYRRLDIIDPSGFAKRAPLP